MPRILRAPSGDYPLPTQPNPSPTEETRIRRPVRVLIVDTAIAFGGTLAVARNLLKHLDPTVIDASLVSACSDGFVSRRFAGQAEVRLLAPPIDYVTLGKWKTRVRKRFRASPLRRPLAFLVMTTEIFANVAYLVRLAYLYRKLRVDVVHANNYSMEPIRAARLLGIPIVYHLHGLLQAPMDGSARRAFRHVTAFISISQLVTESAVRAGIGRERIHEIHNFVEQVPETSAPPLPDEPAIGIFGRVTQWKGQKEFLNAALLILPNIPKLRVYVVGDSSDTDPKYFKECSKIARSSRFADQIEFTGLVNDVASYYRKCTVVVHASIAPEPFGMVLIEAMAQARPVVASTLGAAREIIQDGVDGFLVDPRDTSSLATHISDLLSNPALATGMGLMGYKKAQTQYDPRSAARRFERLYVDIVSSSANSRRQGARRA